MGWLLPLDLCGVGSEDVEALPSYMTRLASSHGVSPGFLLARLVSCRAKGAPLLSGARSLSLAAFVRPNETTEQIVARLTSASSESEAALRSATFLGLRLAIDRSIQSFSPTFRWCPGCLSEWHQREEPAYFKLSWLLTGAMTCQHHRLRLRDHCARCGGSQGGYARWPSLFRCQRCRCALFRIADDDVVLTEQAASAPDLISLVKHLADPSVGEFPKGGLSNFVHAVMNEAWGNHREMELWKALPRDECLRFASSSEPITLTSARRVAIRLDVPLVELLLGQRSSTSHSFGFGAEQPLPELLSPAKKTRRLDRRMLRAAMVSAVVCRNVKPPGLTDVARELGVSVGALRYHCAPEARAICQRWRAFQAAERARKQRAVERATTMAIEAWLKDQSTPMSRKGLLATLRQSTKLPKHLLREEIQRQTNHSV